MTIEFGNIGGTKLNLVQKVLLELKPYVYVVGSFARGENHGGSDVDLYIKERPEEEFDNDWFNELEEHYVDKVIEVFENNDLKWGSVFVGSVHTEGLEVSLDASMFFKIKENPTVFSIDVHGVEMDAIIDLGSTEG